MGTYLDNMPNPYPDPFAVLPTEITLSEKEVLLNLKVRRKAKKQLCKIGYEQFC